MGIEPDTRATTDYRFDTEIVDLTDHGDRVAVALNDGTTVDTSAFPTIPADRSRPPPGAAR
ncbi:hypothetical protein MHIP_43830 [Mycolicibacterium hippocampi]|uniref:Uncharacterized protein n=1 Tax=Mycolicibacterium hippocampi TaxID=659824 RepID=A0A7I9ZS84_9MYCO|nr:hypothetical protein MHIP_43830 [Mycolicibacterium hippocampi]